MSIGEAVQINLWIVFAVVIVTAIIILVMRALKRK